ncbi:HNH endonuclease [Methylotenera versatilis]|uniref:HNH endonuclease n=1 Tax=Methylotenera versatilis TaxID=1055487 RepID=UPI000646D851|nr:HNH endonuclease [Methylotenera versatilis]
MQLKKSNDLLMLEIGDTVTKRNLFDLIQYSKVKDSQYWSDEDSIIGNTPQQGINWIGTLPELKAVIIKTRLGLYDHDGWSTDNKDIYFYSFKANKGKVSYSEKANQVLINQPQYLYPILLFTEIKNNWNYEGKFLISELKDNYVTLHRQINFDESHALEISQENQLYKEGGRKFVTHLIAERNIKIIKELKKTQKWECNICEEIFNAKYGVDYIEAHHKIPISNYSADTFVTLDDFALLCPNCHKAVHVYMKLYAMEYAEIKVKLKSIQTKKCL